LNYAEKITISKEEIMPKTDPLVQMSVDAKKMGMSYGQYATYLATHHDAAVRRSSPYLELKKETSEPVSIKIENAS
jgi:hypothetical protein